MAILTSFLPPPPASSLFKPSAQPTMFESTPFTSKPTPEDEPRASGGADRDRTTNSLSMTSVALPLAAECKYPIVKLDMDAIMDDVVAHLATSLLGHVLFLKNQVPFPVMQLARIPSGKSSARTAKLRNDLLQSFDTLSSHFMTTFTALSTALALSRSPPQETRIPQDENYYSQKNRLTTRPILNGRRAPQRKLGRIYMAIVVGPSPGSARSKVMMGVDGFEMKVWGETDDPRRPHNHDYSEDEDRVEQDKESEEEYDETDEEQDGEDSENQEQEEEDDSEDEEREDEEVDDDEDEEGDSDPDQSSNPPQSRSPSPDIPSPPSPPYQTHAEYQRVLQQADRLLSRVLASSDEDLSAEMAPTQTHILVRAPRRFVHPSWIPMQNFTSSLDAALSDFLDASGLGAATTNGTVPHKSKPKRRAGPNSAVQGIWITPRSGLGPLEHDGNRDDPATDDASEDDELIWWSWDGKLVGFNDW